VNEKYKVRLCIELHGENQLDWEFQSKDEDSISKKVEHIVNSLTRLIEGNLGIVGSGSKNNK
jgi:hypothetical protein